MKRIRHILTLLFAAVMVITAGMQVKAEYEYKVTLLAGQYGSIDDDEKVEFYVPYNGTVTFEQAVEDGEQIIKATAEGKTYTLRLNTKIEGAAKFFCKGFHVSGIETVKNGPQTIEKDMVYVASYGMKGRIVSYTAKFVDAAGAQKAEPKTYYGNIGDKPVITCEYIEGYVPNAIQMTGTLVDPNNLPDGWPPERVPNEFTFVYHPADTVPGGGGGGTTGEGGYTYTDEGTQIVYLPGTGGGGNAGGNAGGNQQNGVNPNNAAPANQQNAADANATDQNPADQANQGPADIIDLDDTDVPLANVTSPAPDNQQTVVNNKPGLNVVWTLALIFSGLGIIALIAILIMLMKRKRKENFQG